MIVSRYTYNYYVIGGMSDGRAVVRDEEGKWSILFLNAKRYIDDASARRTYRKLTTLNEEVEEISLQSVTMTTEFTDRKT